jgi:hypothetical protein
MENFTKQPVPRVKFNQVNNLNKANKNQIVKGLKFLSEDIDEIMNSYRGSNISTSTHCNQRNYTKMIKSFTVNKITEKRDPGVQRKPSAAASAERKKIKRQRDLITEKIKFFR